jgi:hypothetical protein
MGDVKSEFGYTYADCLLHMDHHPCGEPTPPKEQPTTQQQGPTAEQLAEQQAALEAVDPAGLSQYALACAYFKAGWTARDAEVARLQAAIDELVAARDEWAHSDDDCEDERVNIAFSVARSLATKPK